MQNTKFDRNPQTISDIRAAVANVQSAKPASIVVDSLKRIDGKGALRAFASITINGKVTIHSCRIIHEDGKSPWVSLPQSEVKARDGGKSRWYPLIEIHDDGLKKAIEVAVLAEYPKGERPEGW